MSESHLRAQSSRLFLKNSNLNDSLFKSIFLIICEFNQQKHYRYLNQYTNHTNQSGQTFQSKEANDDSNRYLEEITGSNYCCRCVYVVLQVYLSACDPGGEKDKISKFRLFPVNAS